MAELPETLTSGTLSEEEFSLLSPPMETTGTEELELLGGTEELLLEGATETIGTELLLEELLELLLEEEELLEELLELLLLEEELEELEDSSSTRTYMLVQ